MKIYGGVNTWVAVNVVLRKKPRKRNNFYL